MKIITIAFFLFITLSSSYAQDSLARAKSLVGIAIQKEREGGSTDEVSAIFSEAAKLAPGDADLYIAWGATLLSKGMRENDYTLFASGFEKFEQSIELDPDQPNLYCLWGLMLAQYAREKKDDDVYNKAFEKFEKAANIKPDLADIYKHWGETLLFYAEKKKDAESCKKSISIFDKIKDDKEHSFTALSCKGYAYLKLCKIEKDMHKYRKELETNLLKAEGMGDQSAAYNLACYYSLIKEKNEAFKWLEKALAKNYQSRMEGFSKKTIEEDSDLNNIRRDKEFKKIIQTYF